MFWTRLWEKNIYKGILKTEVRFYKGYFFLFIPVFIRNYKTVYLLTGDSLSGG